MIKKYDIGGNEYGSHFIPLVASVINSQGPILELGAGHYSTPLLHVFSKKMNRRLYTADTSKDWLSIFEEFETHLHSLHYIPVYEDDWVINPKPEMWDILFELEQKWGVVFIDHRPGERRKNDINMYANVSEIIVVHDTEQKSYDYENALNSFKYRLEYKRFSTWTTLVSNFINVNDLLI